MAELPLHHQSRPPAEHTSAPSPSVVVCHGLGADEVDLLPVTDRVPEAYHVLSVRAPDPHGPGFSWFEFDGGNPATARPIPETFRRSRGLLDAFVDEAVDRYDLDPDRVGLLGFSQGAVLGMGALASDPARYRWCVAAHGFYPSNCVTDAGGAGPAMVTAGTEDEVVPPERAERAAEHLRDTGATVTERTYEGGHHLGDEEAADVADWVAER